MKQAVNKTIRQFIAESLTTSVLIFSIFSLHWTVINEFNTMHLRLVCIFYRYILLLSYSICFGPSWAMVVERTGKRVV
jgi:glycerol uptake facilitator-like aquaporin